MKKIEVKKIIKEVIDEIKSTDQDLNKREVYISEIANSITRKIRSIRAGDEDYIQQNINIYTSISVECDELKTEISHVIQELKNR